MLVRVWRKGNPLTLLVGMQTSTATMENSVEIPLKTGNRTAICPWGLQWCPRFSLLCSTMLTRNCWDRCLLKYALRIILWQAMHWEENVISPQSEMIKQTSKYDPYLHEIYSQLDEKYPGGASGKEPACQCRRCRFDPRVGKIPRVGTHSSVLAWKFSWAEEPGGL